MAEYRRTRILTIGLSVIGVIILLFASSVLLFGESLLWSALRPDHVAVLNAQTPRVPGAASSLVDTWQEDVRHLGGLLRERHVRFGEFADADAFDARVDSVLELLPELDGNERVLAIAALLDIPMRVGIGAGHTGLPLFQQPLNWAYYSFHACSFEDGVWIALGKGAAEQAVGSKILEMNGRTIDEVLERAKRHVTADNRHSRRLRATSALSSAGFLNGLGVVDSDGVLELMMQRPNGVRHTVVLHPSKLFSFAGLAWGRELHGTVDTWSPADPRPRSDNYRFNYDESGRRLVLQFNRVSDDDDESIAEFTGRLATFVDEHAIDQFVIDLRSNGGGDNQLLEPLVSFISRHPDIDQRGVLYTLIGPRTYSAAGSFASALERRTKTLFAGEPSGFAPNHTGDAVSIALPRTGLIVDVSTRYWQDGGPFDKRSWIQPDLDVSLTSRHHFEDHDPALDAVANHPPAPLPETTLSSERIGELRRMLPGRYRFGPFMVLDIPATDVGLPTFTIRDDGPWVVSDLRPLDREGSRFETDIVNVFLVIGDDGALSIDWRGTIHALPRMKEGERTSVELLQDAARGQVHPDSATGVFQMLAASGVRPDSGLEFLLNRTAYRLLQSGRAEEALQLFELQAELYPDVPNVYDSLGDGYMAVDESGKARAAFRRALELDPGFEHARQMLEKLDG